MKIFIVSLLAVCLAMAVAAQPNGNGNGNHGTGNNGNGNGGCANPPGGGPNVPIDVEWLLLAGLTAGFYFKRTRSGKTKA